MAHEGRDGKGDFDFKTLKPFATAVGVKTGNWTRLAKFFEERRWPKSRVHLYFF